MMEQINALHNTKHCLNAYGYFPSEVAQHMPITGDIVTDVKLFYDLQENGNSALKALRQRGKPATLTHKRLCTAMYIENRIYAGNSQHETISRLLN